MFLKINANSWPLRGIVSEFYIKVPPLFFNTPHRTAFRSLQSFLPLRVSDLQCHFKNWTQFTNTLFLFLPLNYISTFFISLLFNFFLVSFSSRSQISHLFDQINVAHIKDRYFITNIVFQDARGTEHRHHGYRNWGQRDFEPSSHNFIRLIKNYNWLTSTFVFSY